MKSADKIRFHGSVVLPIVYITLGLVLLHLLLDTIVLNEDVSGEEIPLGDTFIIFLLVGLILSSIIMILIFTKLSNKGIRYLYATILTFSQLYLIMEIIIQMLTQFSQDNILNSIIYGVVLLVSLYFLVRFFIVYSTGRFSVSIRNYGIILTSILIGRLISIQLDLAAVVFFAILLSVYDIYSVFRGPLSKIIGKPQKIDHPIILDRSFFEYQVKEVFTKGTPVLVMRNNTLLGVGDPMFYSILLYQSLILWNFPGLIIVAITLSIGAIITNYLLTRISPLPALPLPVGISLIAYLGLFLIF